MLRSLERFSVSCAKSLLYTFNTEELHGEHGVVISESCILWTRFAAEIFHWLQCMSVGCCAALTYSQNKHHTEANGRLQWQALSLHRLNELAVDCMAF